MPDKTGPQCAGAGDQSVFEYACSIGISDNGVYERLQRGYAILRKDRSIISLALAEGYNTEYFRYNGWSGGTSPVEGAVISKNIAEHRQAALYRQLGELSGLLCPG